MERKQMAQRLKELREQTGLRQSQVAEYLGVDQSYLSKIEAGERSISTEQLQRFSELYGFDLMTIENTRAEANAVRFALRARDLTIDDLHVIAVINHIAFNARLMTKMLKEDV